jgi:hypothetical protein
VSSVGANQDKVTDLSPLLPACPEFSLTLVFDVDPVPEAWLEDELPVEAVAADEAVEAAEVAAGPVKTVAAEEAAAAAEVGAGSVEPDVAGVVVAPEVSADSGETADEVTPLDPQPESVASASSTTNVLTFDETLCGTFTLIIL